MANQAEHQQPAPKKPRLVFTDLQRRTLQAIFKVSITYVCTYIRTRTCTRTRMWITHMCARARGRTLAEWVTSYPLVIDSNCLRPVLSPCDMHRQMNIERPHYRHRSTDPSLVSGD
jgi:hypothetical protein